MDIEISAERKAKSLFDYFFQRVDGVRILTRIDNAKDCADTLCEEILVEIHSHYNGNEIERLNYWKEVRERIDKL